MLDEPKAANRLIPRFDLPKYGIIWSTTHLTRLTRAGKFPRPVILGHRTYAYRASDIEAFMRGDWKPTEPQPDQPGEVLDLLGGEAA